MLNVARAPVFFIIEMLCFANRCLLWLLSLLRLGSFVFKLYFYSVQRLENRHPVKPVQADEKNTNNERYDIS